MHELHASLCTSEEVGEAGSYVKMFTAGEDEGVGGGCLPLYAAKIVLRTLTCGDREGVGIVREPNTHWL